jgi:hypothetical protein
MKLACSTSLNLHAEDSADMYRIEIAPGEETVLRTIEELATAIRNGLVTPRSRIYHSASQKWLPIEFHPHYKKALALPERPKSAPVSTPLPGPLPSFAIKREAPRPPEPPPAPAPAPQAPIAEAPPRPRPSIPLPAAAENLPFIEVEIPPRMAAPKPEPAPPPPPAPAPAPTPIVAQQAPAPMPEPVPVAPPMPAAPAPKLELAADAFPSLVQPRSYLPPELEHGPVRAQAHTFEREHERELELEHERPNPLADLAPPMSLPVASRRASGGRPVLVGAGALAVVVVGYLFMTSSRPSSQVAAESAPAAVQSKAAAKPAEDEDLPPEDTDVPVQRPSAITTTSPRSGPPSQAWSSSSGATAPLLPTGPARQPAGAADAIVSAPDIAPPPANVELALPKLPEADSLAPKAQRDTAALKRILKAVGGQ